MLSDLSASGDLPRLQTMPTSSSRRNDPRPPLPNPPPRLTVQPIKRYTPQVGHKRQRKPPRRYSPELIPTERSSLVGSSRSTADGSVDRVEESTSARSLPAAALDNFGNLIVKGNETSDDAMSSVMTAYTSLAQENTWLLRKLEGHKQTEESLLVALMNERQETLRVKEELSRLRQTAGSGKPQP